MPGTASDRIEGASRTPGMVARPGEAHGANRRRGQFSDNPSSESGGCLEPESLPAQPEGDASWSPEGGGGRPKGGLRPRREAVAVRRCGDAGLFRLLRATYARVPAGRLRRPWLRGRGGGCWARSLRSGRWTKQKKSRPGRVSRQRACRRPRPLRQRGDRAAPAPPPARWPRRPRPSRSRRRGAR